MHCTALRARWMGGPKRTPPNGLLCGGRGLLLQMVEDEFLGPQTAKHAMAQLSANEGLGFKFANPEAGGKPRGWHGGRGACLA
jgi:hypothetical protein